MASFKKTAHSTFAQYNTTVIGVPDDRYDNTFDSEFVPSRAVDLPKNSTLRINLKLFSKQISPVELTAQAFRHIAIAQGNAVPAGDGVGYHLDWDKNARLIKDWSGQEWQNFLQGVSNQATLWDSKFWLIPPADFTHLDVTEGSWTSPSGSITPTAACG